MSDPMCADLNKGSDESESIHLRDGTETYEDTKPDVNQIDDEREKIRLQEHNEALIREIAELCNREDRESPEVILLLGSSGVGKSSMINTIIKALTGKYFHKATAGHGNVDSITLTFEWFEHCGIANCDLQGLQRQSLSNCWQKLPNIIDAAGMGVHNSPDIREILEMVLGGFIPPGISVKFLQKKQNEYGVGCLKTVFPDRRKEWAVTKVVFVTSCSQPLPNDLIGILHGIRETFDESTGHMKYNTDVFVVITKCDLVEGHIKFSTVYSDNMITKDQLKNTDDEIAKEFRIEGSQEHNRLHWVSYVDGYTTDVPYIENIALKFVKLMMQPKRKKHQTEINQPQVLTPFKQIKLTTNKHIKEMYANLKYAFLIALFAVILFFIYKALAGPLKIVNDSFEH